MAAGLMVTSISKTYGQTKALTDVSLAIEPGRVVALIGHNGAGKSTLLRALSGAEVPDTGSIVVDGAADQFLSPADATAVGIACVYQELSLIGELTVAENLFLGTEETTGPLLNRKEMNRRADELCKEYGIPARGTDLVSRLPVAQRQLLEVVRGINRNAKYLLLDEPTTALEQEQVENLLDIIRRLTAERGLGVLLVDHKLDEVFAIADHIVGLSNGRIVLDSPADTVDRLKVIDAIVGDHATVDDSLFSHAELSVEDLEVMDEAKREDRFGDVVLAAEHLSGNGLAGVTLDVHAGEVLGIYGLIGAGRSRFLRTVYGAEPVAHGSLSLLGRPYAPKQPSDAIASGVAFLSEERKSDGFIPQMSSVDNAVLPVLGRYMKSGILNWKALRGSAREILSQVTIRGDISNPITSLSGGNQQKALFARATLQGPKLLLLDEPTKGVDIGAKREIHRIVKKLAREQNVAVIVVSSEEEELTMLADTIVVFRHGSCDGVAYPRSGITPAELRELAWAETKESA
ncbi:sugar ABC transporter ATP-binding protein [Sinomonas sp. ASV322]|uniref:sugar ABC transporter ATP-binding protein n=1 Tax=Sinomonas sp. ASV322 TaxID=3041920 RepID=UPI0027DB503F|nr:sugar ABC transporter ATP-binding protein [Sinomonas sp. ASV322]MDQ4501285.1 sugar ABC transporter ATP-binding protein [Sinomonas sp. ASV322]